MAEPAAGKQSDRSTSAPVIYEARDGVSWITLNRPFVLKAPDAVVGLGASHHGIIPDGSVLRLARLIGLARAKELSLLNDDVSAEAAHAIGLVTRVCAPFEVDAALAVLLERLRHQAPTANGHIKRLLQASFHADPRALVEDVLRAQDDCMRSWETGEANRAWKEKREPVFHPRPAP